MHNGRYDKDNIADVSYSDASYAFMGAHESGDGVTFRYCDACADAVFVVGDFNGWSESMPMARIGADGVWEARADKESVHLGDGYKYKIYKNGEIEYKIDPYCESVGDGPYFNSVIVDESHEWRDGEWMIRRLEEQGCDSPINVYAIDPLRWSEDGRSFSCDKLGDELIPYAKQMGYTHICFCNVLDDRADGMLHTYFATKHELGEAEEIKRFTERLHGEGIGVMLGLDARDGTDDDIRLMIESIGYWSDAYHVDGAVIIADTDASDALKLVRRRYKDLLVVDGRAVLEHGRVNINEIDGLCDDWRRFAAMRAVMTYKTVMPFVNITPMGEEIGAEALSDPAATVDWHLLDRELNAKFQLFCSKLNYAYLGCARWWNCRDGEVTVSGDGCPDGVLTVRRTSAVGDILAVINLRPTVYENFPIDATEREYREIFNSDARLYGGSGVTNEGVIKSAPVNEKEKIRIRIPPLAATVLLSVKI